jgi:putative tributyrin esterase
MNAVAGVRAASGSRSGGSSRGARPGAARRVMLFVLGIGVAGAGCAAPGRLESVPQGRILQLHIAAPSLHETSRSVRVYLPPSYSRPDAGSHRYPTVYLLHGWPGGAGNWPGHGRAGVTLDTLIAHHAIPEVIAVMPDGNGTGTLGRSLYLNAYDGRSNLEDFIVRDLVSWVDSTFRTRTDAAHRAVIGLSDGGTAALNLAFRHPRVFGACGGHSGQYRLQNALGVHRVLGPEPGATTLLEEHSPTYYAYRLVPQLKHQTIYFDCGSRDPDVATNRELHETLLSLGVPHTYHEFAGRHGWGYWKLHLRDSLLACLAPMR